jgi:hypothetical protein
MGGFRLLPIRRSMLMLGALLFLHNTQILHADDKIDGLLVPGGLPALSKAIGMNPELMDSPQGARNLFAFILKFESPRALNRRNPVREHALIYLKQIVKIERFESALPAASLPLQGGEHAWRRILRANPDCLLIQKFLENPRALQLYLALDACSQSARSALLSRIEPELLLKSSAALAAFGQDLIFIHGKPAFPGSSRIWQSFLGASDDSGLKVMLERDRGMPLLIYSSLSAAPRSIQEYVTSSTRQLADYYGILRPYNSKNFPDSIAVAAAQDLSRIWRQSTINSGELHLNLDDRMAAAFLRQTGVLPKTIDSAPVNLNPKLIRKLLPIPGISAYAQKSKAGTIEFLQFLQKKRSRMLSENSLAVLMANIDEAPVFLDLIGEIDPDPTLLSNYLRYCRKISDAGTDEWNVNRTRTSQSIFFLIAAFLHQGAISNEAAQNLLGKALNYFDRKTEPEFAESTAEFLSRELIPAIVSFTGNSRDPILSALSGNKDSDAFTAGGKHIQLQRMRQIYESQSCNPINDILQFYDLIKKIRNAKSKSEADSFFEKASEILRHFRSSEWTPGGINEDRNGIAQIERTRMRLEDGAGRQVSLVQLQKIAGQLHTELSVTLLTYCYAYSGDPRINILIFDPNFVRKHRFADSGPRADFPWTRCHFEQGPMDSFMAGSLSGLGFEMERLLIAQSNHESASESENRLAAAVLSGIRSIRTDLFSDRGQQYVALTTQLGRSLLSMSTGNDKLRQFAVGSLSQLISQKRLEELNSLLDEKDPEGGAHALSPSDLFLLGRLFFDSPASKHDPDLEDNSALSGLVKIVPPYGSEEYNKFVQEIDQYGIQLGSRIGLFQLSFGTMDSYERLAAGIRPQLLYDRVCDLKIRIAELNYAAQLPASEAEIEFALNSIISQSSQVHAADWKTLVEKINSLSRHDVLKWMNELVAQDTLKRQNPGDRP